MKQSTESRGEKLSEEEILVCEIILNLHKLISCRYSFTWGGKRRRSVLDSETPHCQSNGERETKVKEIEATSPCTPLSSSPSASDSDDNSKQHSSDTNSKKMEVQTVRSTCQNLNALNLELKAKKLELSCSQKTEKPRLETNRNWNLGMNFVDPHYRITLFAPPPQHQFTMEKKILVEKTGKLQDPFGQKTPPMVVHNFNFNCSSNSGFGLVNQMGPRGIPDLNVSAEETFGLGSSQPLDLNKVLMDDNRVISAEARKRRMMKTKNSFSSSTIKLSRCR